MNGHAVVCACSQQSLLWLCSSYGAEPAAPYPLVCIYTSPSALLLLNVCRHQEFRAGHLPQKRQYISAPHLSFCRQRQVL